MRPTIDGVETRARLAIRQGRASIPRGAFNELYILHCAQESKVSSAKLMSGLVDIKTADGALNYVRAFSSVMTAGLVNYQLGLEVRSRDLNDINWVGGDEKYVSFLKKYPVSGLEGIVDEALLRSEPNLRPSARQRGDVFEVRRLVIVDTDRNRLRYVTEEVTKNGGYRLIQSKEVTTGKLATLQWTLPMYE